MLPLDGITVVAVEQAVAGPFASRQLADLGARVIKIERPKIGDFARSYDTTVKGLSSHFVWLNRSKESLTLDLKQEEARSIVDQLLAKADVFIHNLAPGAVDRLGLGSLDLRKRHPRLIICTISGYGSSGPLREEKAYDLLVQAETGLISITGTEETPSKVGISVADIAAGTYAYAGVLSALLCRAKTGEGLAIEVSLLDALGEWMGYPALYTGYGGSAPPRTGPSHAAIAPYGPFASGGGDVVYLAVQNETEWKRFCKHVLKRPELAEDPRFDSNSKRVRNREALHALIESSFQELSSRQVVERLGQAQIAHGRMRSVQEFLEHPQLAARERWQEVDSPAGPVRVLLPPVIMEGVEPLMEAVPALGQHTEAILRELGFDSSTFETLRRAGVI